MLASHRLLLLASAACLAACLADPAPTDCETGRDCPLDAPWCVDGACALRPTLPDAGLRRRDADLEPPAGAVCVAPGADRCAPVCEWLIGCARLECPRAVEGVPELLAGVAESCAGQCGVDAFVGDQLCALADADRCAAAIDDMSRLLGFGLCR